VAALNDTMAWVVNHVSDDVSIVNLRTRSILATVRVGDEPTDVVFAGSPKRAFVCVSGEDAVKIYGLANPSAPTLDVTRAIFGRHPRSLAAGSGRGLRRRARGGEPNDLSSRGGGPGRRGPAASEPSPGAWNACTRRRAHRAEGGGNLGGRAARGGEDMELGHSVRSRGSGRARARCRHGRAPSHRVGCRDESLRPRRGARRERLRREHGSVQSHTLRIESPRALPPEPDQPDPAARHGPGRRVAPEQPHCLRHDPGTARREGTEPRRARGARDERGGDEALRHRARLGPRRRGESLERRRAEPDPFRSGPRGHEERAHRHGARRGARAALRPEPFLEFRRHRET
jgi:YVTN family beta-propeller protein